jgi:hypothetical protein
MVLAMLSGVTVPAHGQAPAGPFTTVAQDMREREYAPVRRHLVAAARLMPVEHYDFRAADGTRTFAEEVLHGAAVAARLCGQAGSLPRPATDAPPLPPDPAARKAAIAERLDQALGVCDGVLADMTDARLLERTSGPYIRASHLTALLGHCSHVYAKLSLMLRMKGLVPPSTAGRAGS